MTRTTGVGVGFVLMLSLGGLTAITGEVGGAAAPPTTDAPATSVPGDDVDLAVTEAAEVAWQARWQALTAPNDANVDRVHERYAPGGPALAELDGWLGHLESEGQQVREHPDGPPSLTVERVDVMPAPLDDRATAVVCAVDSKTVFVPGDDGDQIVDQPAIAMRQVWELVHLEGQWKPFSMSTVEAWGGASGCPPADDRETANLEVVTRSYEIDAARWHVAANMDDLGTTELLDGTMVVGGEAREGFEKFLEVLREDGERLALNLELPPSIVVETVSLVDSPPPTRADATVCNVDSAVIYEPEGAPDGSDVIIDDDVVTYRLLFHLVIEAGDWHLESVELLGEWEGAIKCPNE